MQTKLKDSPYLLAESEEDADVVVVNSCTVTNGADASLRTYINRLNRLGKKILLTGCSLEEGKKLFEQEKIFGIFDHSYKQRITEVVESHERFMRFGEQNYVTDTLVEEFVGKSRAFVKIQEGCDFSCSYCIIPSVRGASRSVDEGLILAQIELLVEKGFSEFILTGTNVGSYGKERQSGIAALVSKIASVAGVERLRVGSMEPSQIDSEFIEIAQEPFFSKQLHIALQHTSDAMLERMNRKNRFASDLALFEKLANLGFALGTDYIIGHPGESEAIWEEAYANLKALPLTHIHPFSYSKRADTPSSLMRDTVDPKAVKERLESVKNLISAKNKAFREKKQTLKVLIESSSKNGVFSGFDQFYNRIDVESKNDISEQWIEVKEYAAREQKNYAKI